MDGIEFIIAFFIVFISLFLVIFFCYFFIFADDILDYLKKKMKGGEKYNDFRNRSL